MKTEKLSIGSAELAYRIYGNGLVNLVIEMGLG